MIDCILLHKPLFFITLVIPYVSWFHWKLITSRTTHCYTSIQIIWDVKITLVNNYIDAFKILMKLYIVKVNKMILLEIFVFNILVHSLHLVQKGTLEMLWSLPFTFIFRMHGLSIKQQPKALYHK